MIYIVDDDPSVRRSLMRLTRSAGYAARAFESAEQYLAHADERPPGGDAPPDTASCMILDLHVPGMGAPALQDVLNRRRPRMPVIVLSGTDNTELLDHAIAAGAVDVLSKPCEGTLLLRAIAAALAQSPHG
jgi:FixJ family two-component response regulator